jgi:hypothetical protein
MLSSKPAASVVNIVVLTMACSLIAILARAAQLSCGA